MAHGDDTPTSTISAKQHEAGSEISVTGNDTPHTPGIAPTTGDDVDNEKELDTTLKKDEQQVEKGPNAAEDEGPQRSTAQVTIIMLALAIAVFLAAIDVTIITTALPSISTHFGSTAGFTWIGSAYLLGNAASTPLWGKISDIWGRKPILLVANVVFFVGSLLAATSVSIGMLIVARAIQGIGGGGLVVLVNICIGDLFSMRKRSAYYGLIGGVWAVASALGPILGGVFAQEVSWRWCFYINLPLDGLAFVIIFFFLDLHTPRTPFLEGIKSIDWLGAFLIISGTIMLLLGLEFGGVTFPWDSATVLCLIIFGALTIGLFLLNEWKLAKYPITPLRIFRHRSNLAVLGVCFSHGTTFVAGSYYIPLFFQVSRGSSPLLSGVYYLPTVMAVSLATTGVGFYIRKTGHYIPAILAGLTLMTLGSGLFIDFKPDSPWSKIIIYQIIAGLGVGPNFQAPLIALQSGISPRDIASATATFGFVRNLSTAISVVLGTVVIQNIMDKNSVELAAAIGSEAAQRISGASAVANVGFANSLPEPGRSVFRAIFAKSLSQMWIMYTVFGVVGMVCTALIRKNTLNKAHQQLKQGLEGERERRLEMDEEERLRREKKGKKKGLENGVVQDKV